MATLHIPHGIHIDVLYVICNPDYRGDRNSSRYPDILYIVRSNHDRGIARLHVFRLVGKDG